MFDFLIPISYNNMKKNILIIVLCLTAIAAAAQDAPNLTNIIGSWTGKLKAGPMALTIVFNFEKSGDSVKCTLDSPDQGAKGIGAIVDFISEDSVAVSINDIGASYTGRLVEGKLNGTFTQRGFKFPLELTKGVAKAVRPQHPTPPYPYKTEDVTFTNGADSVALAATLTYPVGFETMKKGKVPVVLLVTGSGSQNRDEEIFEHKPFLVIADYLARHGIASLRYDDRGFGSSTAGSKPIDQTTTQDFARDAAAGIAFLRKMKQFGKVGVLGHSEGGNIAFMLGANNKVDFIISMAGVGVKADTALTAQANRILELQGQTMKLNVNQYRLNVKSQHIAWMDWFIDYDPTADIAATRCPIMAINGDKDCQVISKLNLQGIGNALPKNKKTVVKEYPSLNHLFQHCTTGMPTEYGQIEETISPEVLNDITEWIKRIL